MAEDRIEQSRQRMLESLDAEKQRIRQQNAQLREQIDHLPKPVGHVNNLEGEMSVIFEWDDGYGNRVFTETFVRSKQGGIGLNQIKPLSDKIQVCQTAFQRLAPDVQAGLQAEFDSLKGTSPRTAPYGEYLRNESLGRRFQELKQKK